MAGNRKQKYAANQALTSPESKKSDDEQPLNSEHQKMLHWLETVKFKKTLFGGIRESDLWKKLDELNSLYEASLLAERVRYNVLLDSETGSDKKIAEYQKTIRELTARCKALEESVRGASAPREEG